MELSEIIRNYPISDLLNGWFFRVSETSSGAYRAEGKDVNGLEVACSASARDEALEKCKRHAIEIST